MRRFRGGVKFFVRFSVSFFEKPGMLSFKDFAKPLHVFFLQFAVILFVSLGVDSFVPLSVSDRVFQFVAMFRTSLSGQRFVVHFVGQRVGIFRGIIVLVFLVVFFLVVFVLGVQGFLQFLEFRRLDKSFGSGFNGFGAHFGAGERLFMLGFD